MNDFQNKCFLISLLLLLTSKSFATTNPPIDPPDYFYYYDEDCDACGCSNNGGSLGMGGVLENNFVGVRYLYQNYESKDGIFNNSPKIDEQFNTIQLWSKIPVIQNKLDVQAFIPYHSHQRTYTTKETAIQGLGDMSFLVNYTIYQKNSGDGMAQSTQLMKQKENDNQHLLKVGAGVKLPTGNYNQEINNTINPSFQLGTGSIDYTASAQYLFKQNQWGSSNFINYFFKTENDQNYKFGNQTNFNSTFFYVLKDKKKHSYVPTLGLSGEYYQENENFNRTVKNTNGHAIFTNIGFEYNSKTISIGTQGMLPIAQNLAQGSVKANYRTNVYLNFNF